MIKKILNKIFPKHFPTSESLISSLRKEGAYIGEGVYIFGASKCVIDSTRPWLLSIGDYTIIAQGVTILTHDYSLSTLRRVYGEWIGEGKETSIGKNCFVGMNSIILMGTHIGDNVIVGAGSVVHGNIPDNVVIAGNPAKVICTLEEHYKRRREKTKEEALFCAKQYYERMQRVPSPSDLDGFKFLFAKRDRQYVLDSGLSFACHGDEPKEIEEAFYSSEPIWDGFDKLIEEANIDHKIGNNGGE